jgi:membrane protein
MALNKRLGTHNDMVSAAGVAFYGLLALAPTLLALVSIYGLVSDPEDIKNQVESLAGSLDQATKDLLVEQISTMIGADANEGTAANPIRHWISLAVSILLALWSSSGALQKLMGTISLAYESVETRAGWKVRLMSYGFTAAAIVGIALMVLVIGVVPQVLAQVDLGAAAESAIAIGQFPVLAVLFAFAISALYRYAPDRSPKSPWFSRGAWIGTGLFVAFAVAFSIYSSNVSAMPASYGVLGSIAALMIFLQLTALAVIVGAEYNAMTEAAAAEAAGAGQAAVAAGAAAGPGSRVALGGTGSALVPTGRGAGSGQPGTAQPVGFAAAMAGLVALFVLGRRS